MAKLTITIPYESRANFVYPVLESTLQLSWDYDPEVGLKFYLDSEGDLVILNPYDDEKIIYVQKNTIKTLNDWLTQVVAAMENA